MFKIKEKLNSIGFRMDSAQFRLLSFLIPFLAFFLMYLSRLIYPFGNGTVLVLDLNAQYIYFFEALRDALIGEGSLIYSFERALSGEFLGIFAYYLASPLSLLVALFPKENIQEAMLLIIIAKCGLSGLTANIYLTKTRKLSEVGALIFSSCYALSAYGIIYASNTMWLDCMYLLPLIMLGIEKLIRERRYLLYTISLAVALLSSFYIGYMLCIFAVIYFFAYYFYCTPEERGEEIEYNHFIKSGLRFALFSIISAALASPLIFPMLYSLKFGKDSFSSPSFAFNVKTEFLDIFTKLLPASYDTVRPEGMPFIYCSVLCVILAAIYFIVPTISTRKKASLGTVAAILAISFCGSTIDLVWHGLQFPNWLNFRYSFIFTFVMVVIAADAFAKIKDVKPSVITATVIIFILLCAIIQKLDYEWLNEFAVIWAGVGCAIAALIGLRAAIKNPVSGSVVLLCITLIELLGNGIAGIYMMDDDVGYSRHSYYSDFAEKYKNDAAYMKENDPSLYRSENIDMRKVNDNYTIGLNGVSGSTSTLNKSVISFLATMGYSSRSHHSNYSNPNPVGDSLLGIKYVLSDGVKQADPLYELIYTDPDDSTVIYENPYALPLAYTVHSDYAGFEDADYDNPFDVMNAMCGSMLESEGNIKLFTRNSYEIKAENAERTSNSSRKTYKRVKSNQSARLNFVITAETDGVIYAFFPITNGYRKKTNIKYNDIEVKDYFLSDKQGILCLGEHKKGDIVHLSMSIEDDTLMINNTNYFYTLDEELFKQTMETLSAGAAELDVKHTETNFSGKVTVADGRNILMLTMPYDENINVIANGEKCDVIRVGGIFAGVKLPDGEYEFEVKYVSKELNFGLLTALFGLVLLLIYIVAEQKLKAKAAVAVTPDNGGAEESADNASESESEENS